jgi:hypothetical protein
MFALIVSSIKLYRRPRRIAPAQTPGASSRMRSLARTPAAPRLGLIALGLIALGLIARERPAALPPAVIAF